MIQGVEPAYGWSSEDAFECISVDQTHYPITNADFNNRFLTRNRFTKAQVT